MSTAHAPSMLFEELAVLFASAPSAKQIIGFKPSKLASDRALERLELSRRNELTDVQGEH